MALELSKSNYCGAYFLKAVILNQWGGCLFRNDIKKFIDKGGYNGN